MSAPQRVRASGRALIWRGSIPLAYLQWGPARGTMTNFPMDAQGNFDTFSHLSLLGCGLPWSIHMYDLYYASNAYGSSGPFYIDHSFLLPGIKLDHGAAGLYIDSTIFEQPTRGAVMVDPTTYWNGNQQTVSISNSGLQDNLQGYPTCFIYYSTPAGNSAPLSAATVTLKGVNPNSCFANDYFAPPGTLHVDTPGVYDMATSRGIVGSYDDGRNADLSLRGSEAGFGPAAVPYGTLPVPAPQTWAPSGCTVTPISDPSGDPNGGVQLTVASGNCGSAIYTWTGTPAVGDQVLFWTWVYSPTHGMTDLPGVGAPLLIDSFSSTHFTFSNQTSYGQVLATPWDSAITDDWWHPVVGWTSIATSDGTSGQHIRLFPAADSAHTMNYACTGMAYIPASAGISIAEALRWRQQLFHGCVPSNYNGPGVPATSKPIATAGYDLLNPSGGAPNAIIPVTATLPYVGFKSYSGTGTPSDTCSSSANTSAIETNAALSAYQCSNATGSYAWNVLGGSNTVTDGSGTSTANQIAISTGTTHQIGYATALPSGTTATTQSSGDNSTAVATTAYVASPGAITPTTVTATGLVTGANDTTRTSSTTMTNSWTTTGLGAACRAGEQYEERALCHLLANVEHKLHRNLRAGNE